MLSKLKLTLEENINFCQSSNLQGVLMKNISTDYAEKLHNLRFNPYSIGVYKEGDRSVWTISATSREAYENILLPLYEDPFNDFVIYNGSHHIKIKDKTLECTSLEEAYDKVECGYVYSGYAINFATPTAFKSNGKYISFPDFRLIYQNLINKYNYTVADSRNDDTELINRLSAASLITRYDIKSVGFPLEKTKINGCFGRVEFTVNDDIQICKLINWLLTFGEYSGLGIKGSMGMGRILIDRKIGKQY